MAHLHKKIKKGRPYYYVREMARVNGKPKVVNQVYLGSPEKIMELATKAQAGGIARIQSQEFGALWVANHLAQELDLAGIVDAVVPATKNETGPSVGEYFHYCVLNRMVQARSKRALSDWFKSTAIQHIRPVDTDALSSQRFWKKWDRVSKEDIKTIACKLFSRLAALEPQHDDCFMFDTSNYFTFMASDTDSELAQRGKNKEGRDWLRQVGVALLVSRKTEMPLFYREYEGNRHDSKVFARVMDDVIEAMRGAGNKNADITVVFDKGMNAEENIESVDAQKRIHFITSYSLYFAEELAQVDRSRFSIVDTPKNQELRDKGREDDLLTAWRTKGKYWGRERTVVVTYNPLTASKQRYKFDKKLDELQQALYEMRRKYRQQAPHWKNKEIVEQRYQELCRALHLPDDLYDLNFSTKDSEPIMGFRKSYYRIGRHINRFGKNILITDSHTWSTDEIVRASLDRYKVEKAFRQSKDDDLTGFMPLRHWTDSKIRCHFLCCFASLALLRILELRLQQGEEQMTAATAMENMHRLHSCLIWCAKRRKPVRHIEEPDETQAKIFAALGFGVRGGVLRAFS